MRSSVIVLSVGSRGSAGMIKVILAEEFEALYGGGLRGRKDCLKAKYVLLWLSPYGTGCLDWQGMF